MNVNSIVYNVLSKLKKVSVIAKEFAIVHFNWDSAKQFYLQSISPTLYKHLIRQFPFDKNTNINHKNMFV